MTRAVHARWRARYPEKNKARKAAWASENPDKIKGHNAKRYYTKNGKLHSSVARGIRSAIVNGSKFGKHTFELIGYSVEELADHLEALFLPGMSWENYGRGGWHIDHKIPLVAFNFQTPDHIDFKRAWALQNLQPLWESDNCRKHARLTEPFQPSLAIT